jgi:hypothetical protein
MRGAERPAKVRWTHPFLVPLKPLEQHAARQTFLDIADDKHDPEEVDKILPLTGHMPLAINLLAHLADSEGCSSVLLHWEDKKTSLISEGYDKGSNLDLSISISLSSPRLKTLPHAQDLLSLLSILPDGLSDVELVQSQLPIDNILGCKAALVRTSLAYSDENKRLKALVPIREYMHKLQPPDNSLVHALLQYFQELLRCYLDHRTQLSSGIVARISSNYTNLQNILQNGLHHGHPDLVNSIYCTCDLNRLNNNAGWGKIILIDEIHKILPQLHDHRAAVYFITELLSSYYYHSTSDSEILVSQVLERFEQLNDTDLKSKICSMFTAGLGLIQIFLGKFYLSLAVFYHEKRTIYLQPSLLVKLPFLWQL